MPIDAGFMDAVHRIDELVEIFENHPDPVVREQAFALLQAVDTLHRVGLARLVEFLNAQGLDGWIERAGVDPVVHLLLTLYDLLPPDPIAQVEAILEDARAYLKSHGGDLEVLKVADGIVHLRLLGACVDCPASAVTLQQNIWTALKMGLPGFREVQMHPADE